MYTNINTISILTMLQSKIGRELISLYNHDVKVEKKNTQNFIMINKRIKIKSIPD